MDELLELVELAEQAAMSELAAYGFIATDLEEELEELW